ncbi:probable disease resistance protein At1g61300 isoform X1 [Coffea arabica]|uniref:Probable disease resistance protein At1g51480 isoform X1 n=1 Tax=Coffea arabica TaxID=13443 RepID=A0A6P6WQK9_COFAR|nr:probable disease resistance protein At1g51480 isoform X1 [Coffea arabica]XP_027117699.1 probable disease resistance protein At1g51480 isoform X1 [Coffea arabica]
MSVPPPVGQAVAAAHDDAKGFILYAKHARRHVIDLPHNFEILNNRVVSLCSSWKVLNDDINRQSVTRQKNDNYEACLKEKDRILKHYQERIVNRYKKLVGLESGANGEAGNQIPVGELSAASKRWNNKFYIRTFYRLARLDKNVRKFMTEVTELEIKITLEHVTSRVNPEIVLRQSAKELTHAPSHQAVLDSLVVCLCDADCKRIIIHGEPQVGKTNILRNLNNRLVQCPPGLELDCVIWVTFPTRLSEPEDITTDIQDKILQRLDLAGQNSGSGKKEAISRALCEKSYLLLFDGFSPSIELEDIGISEEHEHGKVIIEAKDPYLLKNFKCHKKIELEKLSPQDSRILFDKIIADEKLCEENRDLGDMIVEELGGLPGVIISIARSLKCEQEDCWEGLNQRLKADVNVIDLPELGGVKLAFHIAYDNLKENDRKCVLYAALFPKVFPIPIDILVECWKAEGFLWCPGSSFAAARSEGRTVLNELTMHHLLQKCSKRHAKMPINCRRVALETPFPGEERETSFVKSGVPGHLEEAEWKKARRVSLMQSKSVKLPVNPESKRMSTLFLLLNPELEIIQDSFFRNMKTLRVLALNSLGMKLLPTCLSSLTALQSLYLNNCGKLQQLPPGIRKLKKLEVLDIRGTLIRCLPEEIRSLVNLICLRFSLGPGACNPSPDRDSLERQTSETFSTAKHLNKLEELTIVLEINNGSIDHFVNRIKAGFSKFENVTQFENVNNRIELLLQRQYQPPRGGDVNFSNSTVPVTHGHDATAGIEWPRSDNEALPYFQGRVRGGVCGANCLASVKDKGKGTETLKDKSAILQTGEPLEAIANNFEENVDLEVLLTDQFSNPEQVLQEPPVKQSMPLNNWSPPVDERVQAPFHNYGSASVRLK